MLHNVNIMCLAQFITRIPIFFTINFGQKRPILDRRKKNLLVILDKSF